MKRKNIITSVVIGFLVFIIMCLIFTPIIYHIGQSILYPEINPGDMILYSNMQIFKWGLQFYSIPIIISIIITTIIIIYFYGFHDFTEKSKNKFKYYRGLINI